jgi:hypothetical protein
VTRATRPGVALLDAIVGLFILATAGMAAVVMAIGTVRAVGEAREADAELRAADGFLQAVALWPREELEQRLGDRPQGPWRLEIQRPERELFVLALSDTLSSRVLLRTALYRPEARTDD